MGFFSNLLGSEGPAEKDPSQNKRLIQLLEAYNGDSKTPSYQSVMDELQRGSARLLVPSGDSEQVEASSGEKNIELTSVSDIDGITTLFVFSSEKALQQWAHKKIPYTPMSSSNVLSFAKKFGAERIVIDHNLATMFTLERHTQSADTPKDLSSIIKQARYPIEEPLLTNLKRTFLKIDAVNEVYQFSLAKDEQPQTELQIAFKLRDNNSGTRAACMHAVQKTMNEMREDLQYKHPINLIYMEDEKRYRTIKDVKNALIYKK